MKAVVDSLSASKVSYTVFSDVSIEPTDTSMQQAIDFARTHNFDCFVAVGGGSVMDTAKIANLFAHDRQATLLDYANAPIGKGKPVLIPLAPLVAIPTTSGTGSETTGTAIFDYKPLKAKIGVSHRALKPTLGLIDAQHTATMPRNVVAYTGFDVFCHSLESYTAIPFNERTPRPTDPKVSHTHTERRRHSQTDRETRTETHRQSEPNRAESNTEKETVRM